jgi:type II secretory pathway pseudopilin PulG
MEMLVVISIITLLLAIMSPALKGAKESARGVKCLSQLSQLGKATDGFTIDNKDRLPGIYGGVWVNPNEQGGGCWLSNPKGPQSAWEAAPQTGVIWTYAGRDPALYRCPSLALGVVGSGVGSNGRFDYSAFHAFAGARITKVPKTATITLLDYSNQQVRTPWIIEESPWQYLNFGHVEGGFGGGDTIGNWHNGGGNLVSFDGSAVALRNTNNLSSANFTAKTPKGANVSLASDASGWGGWETR